MSQAGQINSAAGPFPPTIPMQFTTDSGIAIPALNNLNVLGGVGIQTSGIGSTITIDATSLSFDWHVVTSATNPNLLVPENGYIPKGAAVVIFVLPAAANIGDTFIISGYGNLWNLTQNAGQSITLGVKTTTPGIGGKIIATQVRDTIEMICVTPNTEFQIINGIGNLIFI